MGRCCPKKNREWKITPSPSLPKNHAERLGPFLGDLSARLNLVIDMNANNKSPCFFPEKATSQISCQPILDLFCFCFKFPASLGLEGTSQRATTALRNPFQISRNQNQSEVLSKWLFVYLLVLGDSATRDFFRVPGQIRFLQINRLLLKDSVIQCDE